MQTCCCKGRQPQGIVAKKRISRPEVVGLMLKDRGVPRFLVAPDGYGKTHVAFEYACIIFAFEHVLWIRCSSPCFVRDLDADALHRDIFAVDPEAALVVFDELPAMDAKRTEALSGVMDDILAEGCEVMVACSPTADAFGMFQKDRILVTSRELLLDAAEVAALGLTDAPHASIACMAWGANGTRTLLSGCSKDTMPADLRCAMFKMLAMGSGAVDEALALFDEGRRGEIAHILARYYTFLGVDADEGRFDALEAQMDELKAAFLPSFDEVRGCTPFPSADALGMDMADALLRAFKPKRACDLVRAYVSAKGALAWMDRRGWRLILSGQPGAVLRFLEAAAKKGRVPASRHALMAWAFWVLGLRKEALVHARKARDMGASDPVARAAALSLLAHEAQEPLEADETLAFADSLAVLEGRARRAGATVADEPDWVLLGRVMLPLSLGDEVDPHGWRALVREALAKEEELLVRALAALILGAAWSAGASSGGRDDAFDEALLPAVAAALRLMTEGVSAADALGVPLSVLLRSLEEGLGASQLLDDLPPVAIARISELRVELERQVQERAKRAEEAAQGKARFDATHPDPFRRRRVKPVMAVSSIPQLEIRMFGGLEVRIDGEAIDPKKLTRRRTRTLAAALALNKGHELTRERLCQIVWPETDAQMCVNSFYSVWASLKRALAYEGGCPYLVRSQVGCSFDARYLVTDMEEFESTCASLVFGGAQMGAWEDLYAKVTGTFSDGLLPNDAGNPYIDEIRERCKSRLVDGLLAVSKRLLALDERTGALWFAREALRRDEAREDAYIALMEAQIEANQRGPALETYFKCRKFLSDGLGIDPSPKLVELYRSIIECEETL